MTLLYFLKRNLLSFALISCFGLSLVLASQPVLAEVVREDAPVIVGAPDMPLYIWRDTKVKPSGIAIAVHGLIMHGGVYDSLARDLVGKGFLVVAPDLRGFGRWCVKDQIVKEQEDGEIDIEARVSDIEASTGSQSESDCQGEKALDYDLDTARIKYKEAYQDLWQLTVAVRSRYPSLPLYIIGESLGAGMALRLASDMPDSVDGIVLSSPAIKGRLFISARVVLDTMVVMCYPKREVDLKPYIRQLASESPEVSDSAVTDPLVRKRLTVWDLFRTARLIRGNIKHARTVPATMPVLIIQGDRDRMINSNGVAVLIENLKCTDQTVKWLPGKGHLLLETPLIEDETRNTVTEWILEHSSRVRPVKVSLSN